MNIKYPIQIVAAIAFLIIIIALIVGTAIGIYFIIKSRKRAKANGFIIPKRFYLITVISVVVMAISWIMNIGWYRLILTWLPIPLVHTVIFLIANFKSIRYIARDNKFKKYIIFSNLTYLSTYLLFPDGGDIGGMYLFFGLIRNDVIATIAMYLAFALLAINIVILILQFQCISLCKKQ